ncbi:hypothetical protein Q31b_06940 [Novipirellula aureliae]|uniref:Uncharacterized protein n=1 Tax=Novipirellula aureliae TaxID=2527966 RepID=A0A5C6ECR9_9BACT|nr:hypothetical protein [Novipirellula aureliae]TWU45521.1 hypothetical protein Q31b_06940 [Novipirellula aureliae]
MQIDQWQKQLFDNADAAFARPGRKPKPDNANDKKIEALEAKSSSKTKSSLIFYRSTFS